MMCPAAIYAATLATACDLVGILAEPSTPSDLPVMYGVFCYFKGEVEKIQPAEIATEMRQLLLDIEREKTLSDPV
ncbi:MAG: hypothetical protein ACM3S5_14440 [Rhodospirillales bacterium]